jgi:2-polyprenyl-3-methyl-5-hydroxy-6-metoxy-1,4-benzoquinol methylase
MDPEGNELRALRSVADWRGKKVLEIGCGDGRLTRRLASLGAQITAIDPDRALVRKARNSIPVRWAASIRYSVGKAERLRFPRHSFDVVVFAWSF